MQVYLIIACNFIETKRRPMSASNKINQLYREGKRNRWLLYFTVFCRIALAAGFIISGIVKIKGERFASGLSVNHPMGHYLQALFETGWYYTFIGVSQLVIGLLLLIPRTALLGALLYFPTILNICLLAYSVRFEGTRITTFMLLANTWLLVWDFDRIKNILPFTKKEITGTDIKNTLSNKFPFRFFGAVAAVIAAVVIINIYMFNIRPGNSLEECTNGCGGNKACLEFCDCIHNKGKTLNACLLDYDKAMAEQKK